MEKFEGKKIMQGREVRNQKERDSRQWAEQAWLYPDLLQATENL